MPPRIDCDNHILDTLVKGVDTLVEGEHLKGSLVGEVRLNTLDLVEALGFSLIAEGEKVIVIGLKHSAKLLIHCFALLCGHIPRLDCTHNVISDRG